MKKRTEIWKQIELLQICGHSQGAEALYGVYRALGGTREYKWDVVSPDTEYVARKCSELLSGYKERAPYCNFVGAVQSVLGDENVTVEEVCREDTGFAIFRLKHPAIDEVALVRLEKRTFYETIAIWHRLIVTPFLCDVLPKQLIIPELSQGVHEKLSKSVINAICFAYDLVI